jgi:hypothetical protein
VKLPSVAAGTDVGADRREPSEGVPAVQEQVPQRGLVAWVRQLWCGELPLARVFWTDMLAVGTCVNVATLLAAMLMFGLGAPPALAVLTFISPLPYNILLVTGLWRSAARARSEWSTAAQAVAAIWLIAMILI